jgi:hypothetical protein
MFKSLLRTTLKTLYKVEIEGLENLDKAGERVLSRAYSRLDGGEGEIRTHGEVAPTLVFKTRAINHSATSPWSGLFIDFGGVRQEKYFHNANSAAYTTKNPRNICNFTREAY